MSSKAGGDIRWATLGAAIIAILLGVPGAYALGLPILRVVAGVFTLIELAVIVGFLAIGVDK